MTATSSSTGPWARARTGQNGARNEDRLGQSARGDPLLEDTQFRLSVRLLPRCWTFTTASSATCRRRYRQNDAARLMGPTWTSPYWARTEEQRLPNLAQSNPRG
jgi:hypothetical protein